MRVIVIKLRDLEYEEIMIDESQTHKCGWDYINHHAKTDALTIIEADKEE